MLVNVLALAIIQGVAAVVQDRLQILEDWFQGPATPLTSSQLIELVPLAPAPGHGVDRFGLEHLWRLYRNRTAPVEAENEFDFDQFVVAHGSSPENSFRYGEMLFYGVGGTRDLHRAAQLYEEAASHGNSEAQFMLGVAYSTGLYGNWPQDQAMATMYYTFSAMNHSTRGLMAMSSRYLKGYSAPKDFSQAYDFGLNAANDCLNYFEDFPYVGNRYDPFISFIIADEYDSGIYGKINPEEYLRVSAMRDLFIKFNSVQEGLDYIQFRAFEEDTPIALQYLAQAYQFGITEDGLPDFKAAADFAETLAKRTKSGTDADSHQRHSWALSLLGDCYRRGEGRPFDVDIATQYYHDALAAALPPEKLPHVKDCRQCYSGLGMIALHKMNDFEPSSSQAKLLYSQARELFHKGSLLSSPYSQYYMGNELYNQGRLEEATAVLKDCHQSVPQAAYVLGLIYHQKYEVSGDMNTLRLAAQEMALVCKYTPELYSPARWAHYAYERDQDSALLGFTVSAELGFMTAQVNVADILDVQHSTVAKSWLQQWPVPSYVKQASRGPIALMYYIRAAQSYPFDALHKVGDYLYYGIGTDKQISRAIKVYEVLALEVGFPMAYWTMGWFHDHGVGTSQNLKTAKLFYETALQVGRANPSYFAVKFSLAWLYLRWIFARLSGVDLGSISRDVPNSLEKKSWLQALADARELMRDPEEVQEEVDQTIVDDAEDTLVVDFSIIAVVFIAFGVLVWFRRRRGLPVQ